MIHRIIVTYEQRRDTATATATALGRRGRLQKRLCCGLTHIFSLHFLSLHHTICNKPSSYIFSQLPHCRTCSVCLGGTIILGPWKTKVVKYVCGQIHKKEPEWNYLQLLRHLLAQTESHRRRAKRAKGAKEKNNKPRHSHDCLDKNT